MALKGARNIQTTKSIKKGDFTMDLMNLLKLNLQFFSQDDTGSSNPGGESTNTEQDDKKDEKTITLTQKELDKMMSDREKRALKDKDEAIEEAKKLAKMNADQKKEYEHEKTQKENEALKARINRYELGQEATKILAESNITATDEILDFVVREDADKTSEAVKAFSDLVDRISDDRMKEKLKGTSPKKQTIQQSTMTKAEIMKIQDTQERQKLIKENIHLFQ